jgi:hypothetical protein
MAELIRVVRRVLVRGVLYSRSDKAYRLAFITIFSTKVVVAYLPTLAPISMVNEFQLLQALFYQSEWALIYFSFKSSN